MCRKTYKRRYYSSFAFVKKLNINATGCLLFFLALVISPLNAQNKISISLKDTSILAVFDEIRRQTDVNFIYNDEILKQSKSISVELKEATVKQVLDLCLYSTGLTYKQINQTIIIYANNDPVVADRKTVYGFLTGQVVDVDSRRPLPFATILIVSKDAMRGVSADKNGNFQLARLPVGRHTIRVSYIGYKEKTVPEIFVGSVHKTQLTIALQEHIDSLSEVSVGISKGDPINHMAMVSARSFSVEETKRYPASISDPARMVQVYAGITGNDDSSNEIVIRGNSPNWMQWRLEGVEIPSPNHFSEEGYTAGAVSILSSDMLETSDFYMGAFPAEFGNVLSGIFDLRLRNGNSEHFEGSAQIGVLGFDFSAEGPFAKGYKGSFLLNYRYSSLSLLDKVNINISENAVPKYQDLSFKLHFPSKKYGNVSVWGIGGNSDVLEDYYQLDSTATKIQNGYKDYTQSGMYAVGVTHTFFPDLKSYIRTVISNSFNRSSQIYETLDNSGNSVLELEDRLQKDAIRFSMLYNRKMSQKLTIRAGFTQNYIGYKYWSVIGDKFGSRNSYLNGDGKTGLFQGFAQGKYRISKSLTTLVGLHYAYFALSKDHALEPRLGLSIDLPEQQKLSLGYGRHSKNEDLPVYFVENKNFNGDAHYPNRNLKMTRLNHFIISYEKMLKSDLQLKAEVYLQNSGNLPVPDNPNKYWPPTFGNVFRDTLVNIGESRNYGIELTLQKYYTNNYYVLFTASLFDAKYKPANGEWFNSKFNSNYASNLVAGKEFLWGDNKLLSVNARAVWYGGKRLLPLDLNASINQGSAVYKEDKLFSTKGPDYFRIDLGFHLHLFREKAEHIFSLNIQNTTNRRNVFSEEYNPVTQSIDYYYLAGLIPILHYRIEF